MTVGGGWSGPAWGDPSFAAASPALLRAMGTAPAASYRADGGRSRDFLVLGASVSGVSHRSAGRRCEDCFGWVQPAPGLLGLVVADGVGSAGRGGEGAQLAVEAVCAFLTDSAPQAEQFRERLEMSRSRGQPGPGWGAELCAAAIFHASNEISRSGGEAESAGELATTIVVALVSNSAGGAEISLGRVGDSSAFSLSEDGEWTELFLGGAGAGEEEQRLEGGGVGEMLGTATRALPMTGIPGAPGAPVVPGGTEGARDWREQLLNLNRVAASVRGRPDDSRRGPTSLSVSPVELMSYRLAPGAGLVLLTDGVAEPLRDGPATVAPGLAGVLRLGPTGELGPLELARAVDFSRRGAHDDRALLAAWLVGGTTGQTCQTGQ